LPSAPVYELLDDLPEISRIPFPSLALFGIGPRIGIPRFEFTVQEQDIVVINLRVEHCFDPNHFAARSSEIHEHILDHMYINLITSITSGSFDTNIAIFSQTGLDYAAEVINESPTKAPTPQTEER
jgi:hypothetical protein